MGVAVAVVAAAAFLLVIPGPGTARVPTSIDLTADTDASNCVPCHLRLGEASKPGLIFSHGNHLVVSCDSCHFRPSHEDGVTYTPPMETCFNCHGITHGPQGELATGKCEDCHTPSFNLRPNSHKKDWAAAPHADRSKKGGVNQCMMCHDAPKDCDVCHKAEGVDVGTMPNTFLGLMPVKPQKPEVTVYPQQPTSMGQCIFCHPDVDDFMPGRVIFAHAEHLRRNYQCTVCHPRFGHGVEGVRRPDMMSCYRCHGLTHARSGIVATEDCLACHPKDFELKPTDHTKEFEAGQHKERANREPAYCAMCHQPEFCVDCHMGRRPDRKPGKVIPADHKKVDWMSHHGTLFLEQKGSCGSCHDSPSCKLCHQTVMPHPADWLKDHKPETEDAARDCNVCHTDRSSCQSCHHAKVARAELIEENCAPCHELMKQKPATGIKHKGFSEHAVHFGVAETKGKPYKCYECHVGFSGSATPGQHDADLKEASHDLRLCYECHGRLDINQVLIAPYKGADLCRRCHADLNI